MRWYGSRVVGDKFWWLLPQCAATVDQIEQSERQRLGETIVGGGWEFSAEYYLTGLREMGEKGRGGT
jgi:hypothetical protein